MAGGRIGIAELAAALNVDYSQIEAQVRPELSVKSVGIYFSLISLQSSLKANALVRSDSRMFSVLGQVISSDYLDKVAEEINDRLQSEGTISISVLTKELNLPADFLLDQIVQRVGSIIEGFQDESDPKVITTPAHLARNRARVRGVLNAITVPTAVSTVVNRFGFEGRLFLNLAEELIRSGQVRALEVILPRSETFSCGLFPVKRIYLLQLCRSAVSSLEAVSWPRPPTFRTATPGLRPSGWTTSWPRTATWSTTPSPAWASLIRPPS